MRSKGPSNVASAPVQVECQMPEGTPTCANPIVKLGSVDVVRFRRARRSFWSPPRSRPDDGFVLEGANVPNLGERSNLAVSWKPGSEVVVDRVAEFGTHRGDEAGVLGDVCGACSGFEVLGKVAGARPGESEPRVAPSVQQPSTSAGVLADAAAQQLPVRPREQVAPP
jgi:hypothetical protein